MAHVARAHWGRHPNLRILGGSAGPRMPVVAFLVLEPETAKKEDAVAAAPRLQLHWGFVCAVLNDVFGVQARGGCLCAGPYAQALLGIGPAPAARLEAALLQRDELLRPGVVRVSFVYYSSHAAFR
jgi:selenocysteine lyase/cysteine desulfurase